MAGTFTDYLEEKLLKHAFTNTSYTPPSTIYIGLFTAAPSDTGGGTEVSGNAYARVSASLSVSGTSPTTATNGSAIEFAAASGGNWGTITYVGVFDASTSGNLMAYADLTTSRVVNDGDIFRIPASSLTITLT